MSTSFAAAARFRWRSLSLVSGSVIASLALIGAVPPASPSDSCPTPPQQQPPSTAVSNPNEANTPASDDSKPAAEPPATAVEAVPKALAKPAEPSRPKGDLEPSSNMAATRAAAVDRLAKLPAADDKAAKPLDKTIREVLEARLKLVDEWVAAEKARRAVETPSPSPDEESADLKAELDRIKADLQTATKDKRSLLPPNFRNLPAVVAETTRNEIKDAITSAENDLKDVSTKFEEARAITTASQAETASALRGNRDKITQKIATLQAKSLEREKVIAEATNPETRDPAREKLANTRIELAIESERLKAADAALSLNGKQAVVKELTLKVLEARLAIGTKALQAIKMVHRNLSVREEQVLQQAAVKEKSRANAVDDPIERYRAKRSAELLELQAVVVADENALTANPPPTFDEQHALTMHCKTDLENVMKLLDDGRVSHLDALRLNNDFRRIGIERDRIEKNELARCAGRLANAENALSSVEMEMVYDARDDRYELDNLLERLPKADHARVVAMFEELERNHLNLLNRRQAALEKLATRAEETHEQVVERLKILDEHFGFIRTHIFWVRDEEPISALTFTQANREGFLVARAMIRLVAEFGDHSLWGRFSPEFIAAVVGLILAPWPLTRLSRYCQRSCGVAGSTAKPSSRAAA